MANTVLVGAQWGDEGKGKIIDVLTEEADWVVRFQGGNNAGHTVKIDDKTYVLHLIPSGILREGKNCVIGHGAVIDPLALLEEMDGVVEQGVHIDGRLFLSDRAHLVLPYHRRIDELREARKRSQDKIGTTKRGIGPAYGDKAARTGLRMGNLLDSDLADQLQFRFEQNNILIEAMGGEVFDVNAEVEAYLAAAKRLAPYIHETISMLHSAHERGESILCEGAQGTMLDIDYGTYPFVTSSNTTVGGASTGGGMPHKMIDRVIGVIKAYTTRVGEGPFPTELLDSTGEQIRKEGAEFGATTGRPRRCGWFDAVVARYSAMVNGIDFWCITKLDVLDKLETIEVCVGYEHNGSRISTFPASAKVLAECTPVYESRPGWMCKTSDCETFDELPQNAREYIHYLEDVTGVPGGILSVGPGRHSTMRVMRESKAVS